MKKFLPKVLLLFAVVASGALGACGGGESHTVRKTTLGASGWDPRAVAAVPGDPILFINGKSKAQVVSTSPPGLFMSEILDMGASFSWTVPKDTMLTIIQFEDQLPPYSGGTINITLMPPKM